MKHGVSQSDKPDSNKTKKDNKKYIDKIERGKTIDTGNVGNHIKHI